MIFSVGNKRLDIAFDKEVERLISEYRTISAEHENAVRAIYKRQESIISDNRQENTYTPEYLSKLLDQALTAENKSFDSKRQPLNSELRRIIAGYKENLLSALNVPEKGGDYALRINNAIKFRIYPNLIFDLFVLGH